MRSMIIGRFVVLASVAALFACGEPSQSTSPTAPPGSAGAATANGGHAPPGTHGTLWHHGDTSGTTHLIACPVDTSASTSALLGPLGGIVSLGGTSVSIPAGALLSNTTVELTIPAGTYMEVDLSVNGGQSIVFQSPVTVTIDYSRCGNTAQTSGTLSVWNIDEHTKALLGDMGGVDDKLLQQITFTTGHFSGYAVAN